MENNNQQSNNFKQISKTRNGCVLTEKKPLQTWFSFTHLTDVESMSKQKGLVIKHQKRNLKQIAKIWIYCPSFKHNQYSTTSSV